MIGEILTVIGGFVVLMGAWFLGYNIARGVDLWWKGRDEE